MSSQSATSSKDDVKGAISSTADSAKAALESLDDQYFIIDICANLINKKYARDVDSVIQRAKNAGVKKIIVSSNNIQSSKEALRLTRLFPNYVYCAAGVHTNEAKTWDADIETALKEILLNPECVALDQCGLDYSKTCDQYMPSGVHPNEAKTWDADIETALKEILSNPECVALGQCGLDYSKTFSDPDEQKEVLEKQLKIAIDLKKPIIVFEKEAHKDLVEILRNHPDLPEIVIHSFSGKIEELEAYLKLGCYIGLTGSVWKDKSEDGLKKILEDCLIPLDHLLVESDSPFMYPNTRANQIPSSIKETLTDKSLSYLHRYCTFQRNEPCSLPVTIEMLAAYYKLKPDAVALQTTYSALKLFGLN